MKPRPTIYESPRAIAAFARLLARRHVLINIRRGGHKPRDYTVSDIQKFASDYVMEHPELIAEAKAICAELHQLALAKACL